MKFGSVCTGIGAAEQAWKELGWEAAWVAEIEPFPCAVLAHRQGVTRPEFMPRPEDAPDDETRKERENALKTIERNVPVGGTVPNLGDMTRIHESETFRRRSIKLLVGGTPCQSFSVAGLRKGLADPRGNLALVFLGLLDRARPEWVVWENVPGVLSSWSDEAHGPPSEGGLRDLADAWADGSSFAEEIYPPGRDRDRCRSALERALTPESFEESVQTADFDTFTSGLSELGYGVAWVVLDAQHFGVPQRRRRVFVVGYLGDHRLAAAVLLDACCMSGHPTPSRATGQRTSGTISARTKSGGGLGTDLDLDGRLQVAHSLRAQPNPSLREDSDTYVAHTLRGEGFDASEDGTGRGTPLVAVDLQNMTTREDTVGTLATKGDSNQNGHGVLAFSAQDHGADVVFDTTQMTSPANRSKPQPGDPCHPLAANAHAPAIAGATVRRLTVVECERLQSFPDNYTLIPWDAAPREAQDHAETVAYLEAHGFSAAEAEKLADTPDGHRYKGLGNSMNGEVMAWIGARIQAVEEILQERKK